MGLALPRSSRMPAGVVLALGLGLAVAAEARSITVRWRFAAPERAAGFRVHVGSAPGVYTRTIDVGKPPPDAEGIFRATIEVADHAPSFVAVSAYGEHGEESPRSNESVRAPAAAEGESATGEPLGTPGRPRVIAP